LPASNSGTGLAICKHLIDLMTGRIGASGRDGEGSAFWIEVDLPVAATPDVVLPTASAAGVTG